MSSSGVDDLFGTSDTNESETRFTDFFGRFVNRDTAQLIIDWLLDRMIRNWAKYGELITLDEYNKKYEGRNGNYGFDVHDPLNIVVQYGTDFMVLHYDPVIDKIPFLKERQDTIPGFSTWLPSMKSILLESFITLRNMMESQTTVTPVSEFTQVSFAHQIGAVARLRARIDCITAPRLPRCHVKLGWNERWEEIQIGVVKILQNEDIQIVAFSFHFGKEDRNKFKKTCTRIRRVGDGHELDPDIFQVWNRERRHGSTLPSVAEMRESFARQPRPASDSSDSSEFASDAASDADDNDDDSGTEKMAWSYRPLDFSDVEGEGPFNIDNWHTFNYGDLKELVFSWGIRGALLIPVRWPATEETHGIMLTI
ncbi:hypothetical protein F5X97DRAFT_213667 [Nemania serpens]|nr:hypothetical protein F5X97DRAFT_213667 [Nemania serpens]